MAEGIAAEADLMLCPRRGGQQVGDRPLAHPGHPDRPRMHHRPGPQPGCHILQHGRHDLRHPGQDEDVADLEPRRIGHRIGDQRPALRNPRHPPPRRIELVAIPPPEDRHGVRMLGQGHAEGRRHSIGGDVVMGRPDPAGGEDIVVGGPQGVQTVDDLFLAVPDGPRLLEVDPQRRQEPGDGVQIGVLRPAGQDLVTDDQDGGGGGGFGHGHTLDPRRRPVIVSP